MPTREIHTSERKSFKSCRRQWNLEYIQGWIPPDPAFPLDFGTAFHVAYETYYNPKTWDMAMSANPTVREVVVAAALGSFSNSLAAQRAEYLDKTGSDEMDAEYEARWDELVDLGKGMLRYYFSIAPDIDKHWKPIYTEIEFSVPIVDENGYQQYSYCCSGQDVEVIDYVDIIAYRCLACGSDSIVPLTYGGRLDAIFVDNLGRYWIVDWKSAAALREDTEELLDFDEAITSYCMAVAREMGINIHGFVYHEQAKRYPEPPKLNKTVRLGRKYSIDKSFGTTVDLYIKTISEGDPDGYAKGAYDEHIAWMRENPTVYYRRFPKERNRHELDNQMKMIVDEAAEMTDPNTVPYPRPGMHCKWCAFKVPCLMMNDGSDYGYTLKTLYGKGKPKHELRKTQDA